MKLWIKLGGTALMACTAAVCAWAALGGITGQAPERENTAAAYSGCVAVFASVGDTSPITLTDIEVGTLRDADRQILSTGLAVADREELLTLLEDLGT